MNDQITKPSSTKGPRCRHYTARGHRCRLPALTRNPISLVPRLTLRVKVTKIRPSQTSRMLAAMQETKVLPRTKAFGIKPLRGGK
jgi:hypothetical protein